MSPAPTWCGISDGQIYVLEDNLRCPSGVSYVLENRAVMKSMFPQVFAALKVRPVAGLPAELRDMLEYLAPDARGRPRCVLLTPGIYNSAYFEHSLPGPADGHRTGRGPRPGGRGRRGAACARRKGSSGWT